jgi:predicted Fe-Mo cluster-binding NifX family protein
MRIAVSADGKGGLDSVVSPHFGRCPCFVLVDVEGQDVAQVSQVDNPYYGAHRPGDVPRFIHQQGADVMLTGGMGGRAVQFFAEYGVEPVTGAHGTVRLALERYLGGELKGAAPYAESQAHGHAGHPPEGEYEEDEIGRLREEAEALRRQLDDALDRLNRISRPE